MINDAKKLINKASNMLRKIVRRGILNTIGSDYFGQIEGYSGEYFDDVELWQQFGLTSRPPSGSEAIVLQVEGDSDNPVAVSTQSRGNRPDDLSSGETCLHSLDGDGEIRIKPSTGHIDVIPGTGTVNLGDESSATVDFALKGTSFNTANATLLALVSAAATARATAWTSLAGLPINATIATQLTAAATADTALATGVATYLAGAASLLSTKVKLK